MGFVEQRDLAAQSGDDTLRAPRCFLARVPAALRERRSVLGHRERILRRGEARSGDGLLLLHAVLRGRCGRGRGWEQRWPGCGCGSGGARLLLRDLQLRLAQRAARRGEVGALLIETRAESGPLRLNPLRCGGAVLHLPHLRVDEVELVGELDDRRRVVRVDALRIRCAGPEAEVRILTIRLVFNQLLPHALHLFLTLLEAMAEARALLRERVVALAQLPHLGLQRRAQGALAVHILCAQRGFAARRGECGNRDGGLLRSGDCGEHHGLLRGGAVGAPPRGLLLLLVVLVASRRRRAATEEQAQPAAQPLELALLVPNLALPQLELEAQVVSDALVRIQTHARLPLALVHLLGLPNDLEVQLIVLMR